MASISIKTPDHGFRPESDIFEFGKKGYHLKEHLKGSRMMQISAS